MRVSVFFLERFFYPALLLPLLLLLVACEEGSEDSVDTENRQTVTIAFAAQAGTSPFDCDNDATGMGVNADQVVELRDFRLYIGNLRLLEADGTSALVQLDDNDWQLQDGSQSVALLDFVNRDASCAGALRARRLVVTGKVPPGDYTRVEFELGVPAGLNHLDVAIAPAPLNVIGMDWSWQSGHKFLRLETGYINAALAARNQVFHLGSTGCTGGSAADPFGVTCSKPYRPTIRLDGFDPATGTIVADVRELYDETDLDAGSLMCMPGTSAVCQAITAKVGADANGASIGTQSFFRIE